MKLFAFFIASLFMFQASAPVLCGAACEDAQVKMLHADDADTPCESAGSCCMNADEASCEMMLSEASGEENPDPLPCTDDRNCCTPCCAVPLCTCFCQECSEPDFTSPPQILAAQLPSSNGIPHEGFRADCFQPPEIL